MGSIELRAAAQEALEALEADNSKLWPSEKRTTAITALKAALAEPVQEPVATLNEAEKTELLDWVSACQSAYAMESNPRGPFRPLPGQLRDNRQGVVDYVNEILESRTAPPQRTSEPVQEPVAWLYRGNLHATDPSGWCIGCPTPLYTAPPQRKPLTEEEIREMFFAELRALPSYPSAIEELPERLARAIERKHEITP